MIGNFEPTYPNLNLGIKQISHSDLSGITSILLVKPSVSLTKANALILSSWLQLINAGSLFPIHGIIDVEDSTEDAVMNESKQGFRYQAQKGKPRFICKLNGDVDYFIALKKYEGQNLYAYLGDINNNLFGVLNGSSIYPFTLDSLYVKKIGFGVFGVNSMIGVGIDFADASELEYGCILNPAFGINSITNELVSIFDLTAVDSKTVDFSVTDSCGGAVIGIAMANIAMNDDINGALTNSTLTDNGNGSYRLVTLEDHFSGSLNIFNQHYHGNAEYSFSAPDFNPVEFSSEFKIT